MHKTKIDSSLIASIIVLILINYTLISLVYYGHKRENIAAKGESTILGIALRSAKYDIKNQSSVLVVNATAEDILNYPSTHQSKLIDLHASVYGAMIKKAYSLGATDVILNWLSGAHQIDYSRPNAVFTEVNKLDDTKNFMLTSSLFYFSQIPKNIQRRYNMSVAIDCGYEINLYCSTPAWNEWAYTSLYKRHSSRNYLTTNLPHQYKNLVLNLPSPEQIQTISATKFLENSFESSAKTIVFGNDIAQPKAFENNKQDIQKTKYAKTGGFWINSNIQTDGTPLSNFMAAFIAMLQNNKGIFVANEILETIIAAISVLFILTMYTTLGIGPAILSALSSLVLLVPTSYIEIQYLGVYVPKFLIALTLFLTIISVVYIHLFWARTQRITSETEAKIGKNTLELRKNFLSLISHNLKTPIAQLQAGAEYLDATDKDPQNQTRYKNILKHASDMNRNIGIMLKTATLQSKRGQMNTVEVVDILEKIEGHSIEIQATENGAFNTSLSATQWRDYIYALLRTGLNCTDIRVEILPSKAGCASFKFKGKHKKINANFEKKILRRYIVMFEAKSNMTHRFSKKNSDIDILIIEPRVQL